jgi:hypothetical protein
MILHCLVQPTKCPVDIVSALTQGQNWSSPHTILLNLEITTLHCDQQRRVRVWVLTRELQERESIWGPSKSVRRSYRRQFLNVAGEFADYDVHSDPLLSAVRS